MVNPVYFLGFWISLLLLSAAGIFAHEYDGPSRAFFLLYATMQCSLEVILLAFITKLSKQHFLVIAFTALIFFLHIGDYFMNRMLDLSILHAVKIFVLDETWENFLFLLDASGLSSAAWLSIAALALSIFPLAILLYRKTHSGLYIRKRTYMTLLFALPTALFTWDHSTSSLISPDSYTAFLNSLPWKRTFFTPPSVSLSFSSPLRSSHSASATAPVTLSNRPNIYLFITESLREDFITPEVAPNLSLFKQEVNAFPKARSNGNGTHLSWFPIFFSEHSIYWKKEASGAPTLDILKKWGYKLNLYCSAELGYYGMEKKLFGNLLDNKKIFLHTPPASAADSDRQAILALQEDLKNPAMQEGNVFIIFWDGTHFEYSWPKDYPEHFTPLSRTGAYFNLFQSEKTLEGIKNRYRNSIHFMDSLFGAFYKELPRKEEAIVVFMGDHAEEFFEEGHLFHNSHLSDMQTHIPLYIKLGKTKLPAHTLASQMDIFPTILDYVGGATFPYLAGRSLLKTATAPFATTARFNGCDAPYEFCIHTENNKLVLQIVDPKTLRIVSLSKPSNGEEFFPAFRSLFPASETALQSAHSPWPALAQRRD